jgi:DNA-binding winged helix-turn-helix (wHTH) protein/predicted ATPase
MSHAGPADCPAIRIEPENEWAWCGERRLDLTPKAFAILRHLVSHPERLITKEDLFAAVWGDTVVSESALTSCIRDIRRALEDPSRTPRYIETVHRRGFRFIGPIAPARPAPPMRSTAPRRPPTVVGRDAELARLHALFETASGGRRQLVFVTGEAGIGKTTVVEAFLDRLDAGDGLRIGRGQCVEQYGAGEAYLPVLEALGRLAREPRGDALVHVFRRYAPSWLAQLPALLSDDELEAVRRRAQGTTRERGLREIAEALDVVSADVPLVLVLEDLHWSDSATVDLLAMLARRRDPARLMVLATYRPADLALRAHPLKPVKQELQLHGHCEEVALDFLSEAAVGHYLAERFPSASFGPYLTRFLHRNTSGNPLFLVNVVDHLIARGHVREGDGRWELSVPVDDIAPDVPDTLWQLVDRQIERLTPDEQAVLALGSVAGAEFSAALATVDDIDAHRAEACCAALARREQFLRGDGRAEWPDGTIAGRYAFIHALYRNVLYARVSIGHRVGLHLRIGARLERAYGRQAGEIAGELAMHFENGRDFERAVRYRTHAADNALRRFAPREAAQHATGALELLAAFPESSERIRTELTIQTMLGAALIPLGSTAPEVARTFARARELCALVGATPDVVPTLVGLFRFYISRGEVRIARDVADQLSTLAGTTDDAAIRLAAHNASGMASFYAGDFPTARAELERGLDVYDPRQHSAGRSPAFWGGHDSGVSCAVHSAWALWLLGHPARAAARMRDGLAWAHAGGYPFTIANASHFAATFYACRRDPDAVRELVDTGLLHSIEHGFELLTIMAGMHRAWLDGDAAEMRAAVVTFRNHAGGIGLPTFLGLSAEAYERSGRADEGLAVVAEARAMSNDSGANYWDAELERLQGVLLLRQGGMSARDDAESCFRRGIAIAQRQQAKLLELRAVTSLGRLWQSRGEIREARALLFGVYEAFDEGFETPDLRDAKTLLGQLDEPTRRRHERRSSTRDGER